MHLVMYYYCTSFRNQFFDLLKIYSHEMDTEYVFVLICKNFDSDCEIGCFKIYQFLKVFF